MHVQLGWEGTKEKFWPVFIWQVTATRSKQAPTARESRAMIAQVLPSLILLPMPAPTVRMVQISLHLWENGTEILSSHSVITSERGRGCRVRDVHPAPLGSTPATDWSLPASHHSFHPSLHHCGHISQCHSVHPSLITLSVSASIPPGHPSGQHHTVPTRSAIQSLSHRN